MKLTRISKKRKKSHGILTPPFLSTMIFTFHLAKTSVTSALGTLWNPPKQGNVAGLIHAECMIAMTLGSPIFSPSRMLLGQLVVFAQWENEIAIDKFLENDTI